MNVAHVTATFPPYFGGTGNVAFYNARALARLGHRVTVYTADGRHASARDRDEFQVRRLKTPLQIGNAPLVPGLLLMERHDLVHLHYPFIFGAEMVLALRTLRNQPYVLTHHNDLVSPGAKGVLFSLYERLWSRRVLAGARRVVVTSRDSAAASHLVGPLMRADPARVSEVPNGVDMTVFRAGLDGSTARERLGIGNADGGVLLFVGWMDSAHHPKGGVPVLLEAVHRLGDPEVVLVLAGGGDRVAEYASQARQLGVDRQVRFLGTVPNEELPPIYAACDIVVQPSQLFEPFGLVALEAMACGRPVIVSDLPGVRRVVQDAGGGVLVPPGDADALAAAIRSLLADPGRRASLGAAGRTGVEERYDWAAIAPLLVRTYEDALAGA